MIFQKQRLEHGRTEENKWIHPCLTFKALVWFVLLVIFFVPLDKESALMKLTPTSSSKLNFKRNKLARD